MKTLSSTSLRFALLASLAASVVSFYAPAPLRAAGHNAPHTSREGESGGGGGGSDDGGGHDTGDDHGGTTGGGHDTGDDHGGGSGGHHHENQTEFLGTIKTLPGTTDLTGSWTVDGKTVVVTTDTQIRSEHGLPALGSKVEVEGTLLADGSIQASRIKTEDHHREREDNVFFGKIEALPAGGTIGTWQVSGLTVLVTKTTHVETEDAAPAIGLSVRVEGIQQANASIVASEVEIKAENATAPAQVKLKGIIRHLPSTFGHEGNWLVDKVLVTVTSRSKVKGTVKLKTGRQALVTGEREINGTILASKVQFSDPSK